MVDEKAVAVSPTYLRLLADLMDEAQVQTSDIFCFSEWLREIKGHAKGHPKAAAALLLEECRLVMEAPPLRALMAGSNYLIVARGGETGIRCRQCGRLNMNAKDAMNRFCGCHHGA